MISFATHGRFVVQKLRRCDWRIKQTPRYKVSYKNLYYSEFTTAPNVVNGPDWLQTFTPL